MSITRDFILAGEAVFTIELPPEAVTDDKKGHYTFKVERVKPSEKYPSPSYFVRLLAGPDNTTDYVYLGKLDPFTSETRTTTKSKTFEGTFPLRLLNRVLARVWTDDHETYESHGYSTHHEGRCGRCGRLLTVPESIESGIGPECAKKMGLGRDVG